VQPECRAIRAPTLRNLPTPSTFPGRGLVHRRKSLHACKVQGWIEEPDPTGRVGLAILLGAGHCDAKVQRQTLPDTVSWMWRSYQLTP
jgi:hypothetical protein